MRHGVGFKTSDILFNKMKSLADKQLASFKIGKYQLDLNIFGKSNSEPVVQKCYSFYVNDDQLSVFDTITDQYRSGLVYPIIQFIQHSFSPKLESCPVSEG